MNGYQPIWVLCEGSGSSPFAAMRSGVGLCGVCHVAFSVVEQPSAHTQAVMPHKRQDIKAMTERGDFL